MGLRWGLHPITPRRYTPDLTQKPFKEQSHKPIPSYEPPMPHTKPTI